MMIMRAKGFIPSVFDFTKFWSGVIKIKQYSVALHLFYQMHQMDAPLDDCSLSVAINCFCCLKRPDYGFAILGIIFKCGFEPDVVSFTTLMKGLMLVGKIQEAAKLLGKLVAEQVCCPNEVTYLSIINGLCKAGHTHDALDLLMSLEKGSCKPNVYAYNVVIDALCKDQMVDDALQLFSSLAEKGVPPNVVTYTSMIQGLCNFSRWKDVEDLLNKMVASDLHPDVVSYNILMDALCRGKAGKGRKYFDNYEAYTTLIGAFCKEGQIEEAKELVLQMGNKGCLPNRLIYNVLIRGLVKRNGMQEAAVYFKEMQTRGFTADASTSSMLLQHLHMEGQDAALID